MLIPKSYTKVSRIGRGAYGMVISAFTDDEAKEKYIKSGVCQDKNGRITAMAIKKLMNPFRDRFFADRALRELMIMASANHPNVIKKIF